MQVCKMQKVRLRIANYGGELSARSGLKTCPTRQRPCLVMSSHCSTPRSRGHGHCPTQWPSLCADVAKLNVRRRKGELFAFPKAVNEHALAVGSGRANGRARCPAAGPAGRPGRAGVPAHARGVTSASPQQCDVDRSEGTMFRRTQRECTGGASRARLRLQAGAAACAHRAFSRLYAGSVMSRRSSTGPPTVKWYRLCQSRDVMPNTSCTGSSK
jgi:hypothetical protein